MSVSHLVSHSRIWFAPRRRIFRSPASVCCTSSNSRDHWFTSVAGIVFGEWFEFSAMDRAKVRAVVATVERCPFSSSSPPLQAMWKDITDASHRPVRSIGK
jgi:hypothetical protein